MSRTYKDSPQGSRRPSDKPRRGRRRNITVRSVRRDEPDYRRLGRAIIEMALAESEAEAQHRAPKSMDSPQASDEADADAGEDRSD
jgi:hypothetical protein